jgi:DNA-binding NarL/FixJ family response regulator
VKKILVVDDHTIFRQCIVGQINTQQGCEVVAETGSGAAAVRLAEDLAPDVIIMDISLPDIDGIEAVKRLRQKKGKWKIILLSMYKYPEIVDYLEEIGVDGYLLKNDAFEDLLYAIKAVSEGKRYISPSLLTDETSVSKISSFSLSSLTEREKEIVSLIAEGLTSREIADRLCISIKTVETHRARIMEKLKVRNVAELIRYAIKVGILKV